MSEVISKRCDCCQKEARSAKYDGWIRISAEQETLSGLTSSYSIGLTRIVINGQATIHSSLDFCSPECAGKALFAGVR
jgi:hypothetical protein